MKLFKPTESPRSELKNMVNYVVKENNLGGGKPPRCFRQTTLQAMLRAVDGVVRSGTLGRAGQTYRGIGEAVTRSAGPASPLPRQTGAHLT